MFSFNFYFTDTNELGSLADWFMVGATVITGIFLILTFRSQEKLKKIELIRYIDSIKPYFHVEMYSPTYEVSDKSFISGGLFLVTNMNTSAFDVSLTITSTKDSWHFYDENRENKLVFPISIKSLTMKAFSGENTGSLRDTSCFFYFEYFDAVGNKYQQIVVYAFIDGIGSIKNSIPVLVGDRILKI